MAGARSVAMRGVALGMAWVFGFTACASTGCGGGGGSGGGVGPVSATTRAHLEDYSRSADALVDATEDVVRGAVAYQDALDAADDAAVDAAIDSQATQLNALDSAIEELRAAAEGVQDQRFGAQPNVVTQSLAFLPVLATLAGLASFASYLRARNAAADEARMRRDAAQAAIDANVSGATDDYMRAQNDLNDVGADVIRRTTTEVVTNLVLSPVNPTSVGGIVVKELAGQALQEGMTVLTSTPECAQTPPSNGCRVGISRTDASGTAQAPAGTLVVSISGPDMARTELDEVHLLPGEIIEIWIDLVETADLGDEGVAGTSGGAGEGGAGRAGSGSNAGTSGGNAGTSGGNAGTSGGNAGTSGGGGPCSHPDAVGTDVPVQVDIETPEQLQQLVGCTSVGGLEIPFGTRGITSLAGLESLTEIRYVDDPLLGEPEVFSGQLSLSGVDDLTDISALRNLRTVAASVSIDLANVREVDLSSLVSVGDNFATLPGVSIGGDQIGSIDLGSLDHVLGDLHFTADNLDTLVLTSLTRIQADDEGYRGGLIISDADRLAVLELPALTTIEGDLWVYWSDGITAIRAPLLSEVRVDIRIEENTVLTTVGLDSITAPTGGVIVFQNTVLTSIGLNGIPSVMAVGMGLGTGDVSIEYNPVLTSLGMASLTSVSGTLSLGLNAMLTSETSQAFRDRVTVGGM